MPKCPNEGCGKEITSLNGDFMEWNRYTCSITDKAVAMDCKFKEVNGTADENGDNQHYYCPECEHEITDKYDEAEAFLSGEWDGKSEDLKE